MSGTRTDFAKLTRETTIETMIVDGETTTVYGETTIVDGETTIVDGETITLATASRATRKTFLKFHWLAGTS